MNTSTSQAPRSKSQQGDALNEQDDNRIVGLRPLIPPVILMEEIPMTQDAAHTVTFARLEAERIISGEDDRLLVVVGPCSIHDVAAAKAYAELLKAYMPTARNELQIVMRVYFEKPRTTVGWKGLINDPELNGSFAINRGLRIARQLLVDLNSQGVPAAVEFLDTISPQFIADLVSWGAIGARTTESQVHRELASGLSVPVGFKNGTDGNVKIAIDAIRAASVGHHFLSVTKQGLSAIVETSGNNACHVILRGSNTGPNYTADHVLQCGQELSKAGLRPSVMIDFSHGNSSKNHLRQIEVAKDVAQQLAAYDPSNPLGNSAGMIFGVMIESHIKEGRQNLTESGAIGLEYGKSITDACISWADTVKVLDLLREGVRARRAARASA